MNETAYQILGEAAAKYIRDSIRYALALWKASPLHPINPNLAKWLLYTEAYNIYTEGLFGSVGLALETGAELGAGAQAIATAPQTVKPIVESEVKAAETFRRQVEATQPEAVAETRQSATKLIEAIIRFPAQTIPLPPNIQALLTQTASQTSEILKTMPEQSKQLVKYGVIESTRDILTYLDVIVNYINSITASAATGTPARIRGPIPPTITPPPTFPVPPQPETEVAVTVTPETAATSMQNAVLSGFLLLNSFLELCREITARTPLTPEEQLTIVTNIVEAVNKISQLRRNAGMPPQRIRPIELNTIYGWVYICPIEGNTYYTTEALNQHIEAFNHAAA